MVFVGVDMGTTGVRARAYDTDGGVLAAEERKYQLYSPEPDRAEQKPQEILDAVLEVLSGVAGECAERGERVSAVSWSAAMHSLMALDGDGEPITPVLTYADNRAAEQVYRLREERDWLSLHRRTGTPVHPMSPLAKLLWFREEDPDTFQRAARWVSAKEYVLSRLCGEYVVDHSVASATGLFNLEGLDWDSGALELLDLPAEKLSRPVPTTHVLEGPRPEEADRIGLDRGTPFVAGGNDGALANLGLGAVEPGVFAISIGTSGAVRAAVEQPEIDREGRTFCYVLDEDTWVTGGPINNGGLALRWARENLFPGLEDEAREKGRNPYDLIGEMAAEVPAGSEGLIFLPYLAGERAPQWDPEARGVFFGLDLRHHREHLLRAVLEGVAHQIRAVSEVLEEVTGEPREVRATGGFAHSELWRQVLTDVLGREVSFPEIEESSCWGAALLGMEALGEIGSLSEAAGMASVSLRHRPDPESREVHRELAGIFDRLYERLQPEFAALSRRQESRISP